MDIVYLIETFGFEVVMIVGLGYFVFFVWQTITKTINPALAAMRATIIRLTDQLRLLDQDMIRLQQKVNTVTELKEEGKLNEVSINTLLISPILLSDEIVQKFKNPSFSGSGTSAHYLTIENQEKSRKEKYKMILKQHSKQNLEQEKILLLQNL